VPIVAVTGTNGKTTTSRMIAHIFKGLGRKVGMTSTDGIVIDERLVVKADASGPRSARMVLQNPRVDFAVMEVARGGILREGLGYDRNDVAVVTNVAPDHLGCAASTPSNSSPTSRRSSSRPSRATASPCSTPTTRSCADAAALLGLESCGSASPNPAVEVRDLIDDHCRRGGRAWSWTAPTEAT
jgi:cyanophycin synthetase